MGERRNRRRGGSGPRRSKERRSHRALRLNGRPKSIPLTPHLFAVLDALPSGLQKRVYARVEQIVRQGSLLRSRKVGERRNGWSLRAFEGGGVTLYFGVCEVRTFVALHVAAGTLLSKGDIDARERFAEYVSERGDA